MGLDGVLTQIPLGANLFFCLDFVPISETSVSDRGSKRLSSSAPGYKDCNALLSLLWSLLVLLPPEVQRFNILGESWNLLLLAGEYSDACEQHPPSSMMRHLLCPMPAFPL